MRAVCFCGGVSDCWVPITPGRIVALSAPSSAAGGVIAVSGDTLPPSHDWRTVLTLSSTILRSSGGYAVTGVTSISASRGRLDSSFVATLLRSPRGVLGFRALPLSFSLPWDARTQGSGAWLGAVKGTEEVDGGVGGVW